MSVEMSLFEIACKQGLQVVLSIGVFGLCVWLVKHIAIQIAIRMDRIVIALDKLQDKIEKHDEKAEERGRYVREEHREMINSLGRINGYRKEI